MAEVHLVGVTHLTGDETEALAPDHLLEAAAEPEMVFPPCRPLKARHPHPMSLSLGPPATAGRGHALFSERPHACGRCWGHRSVMPPGKPSHVDEEARNLGWISPLPFCCRPEKAEEPAKGAPSPGRMQYPRGRGEAGLGGRQMEGAGRPPARPEGQGAGARWAWGDRQMEGAGRPPARPGRGLVASGWDSRNRVVFCAISGEILLLYLSKMELNLCLFQPWCKWTQQLEDWIIWASPLFITHCGLFSDGSRPKIYWLL